MTLNQTLASVASAPHDEFRAASSESDVASDVSCCSKKPGDATLAISVAPPTVSFDGAAAEAAGTPTTIHTAESPTQNHLCAGIANHRLPCGKLRLARNATRETLCESSQCSPSERKPDARGCV